MLLVGAVGVLVLQALLVWGYFAPWVKGTPSSSTPIGGSSYSTAASVAKEASSEPSVASSTVVGKMLILRASYEPSPAADHPTPPVPCVPLFTVSSGCATLIILGQQVPVKG